MKIWCLSYEKDKYKNSLNLKKKFLLTQTRNLFPFNGNLRLRQFVPNELKSLKNFSSFLKYKVLYKMEEALNFLLSEFIFFLCYWKTVFFFDGEFVNRIILAFYNHLLNGNKKENFTLSFSKILRNKTELFFVKLYSNTYFISLLQK